MALIFPFDTTLAGHVEEVEIKIADLDFPLFTFPKGSFFVPELYGVIKSTGKIARPGLDYKILSLNENIAFNDNDSVLNDTLKLNYVRNCILWKGDSKAEVTWQVPYCGGEETYKPSEYENYLNTLYNEARDIGTLDLYLIPYQGWGGFVNPENKQILDGKNIYNKYFDYYENINEYGGLGWGKVQLAMMALADVVTSGGDPLELSAFYDWVRANIKLFEIAKAQVIASVNDKISALDNIRVANGQYVFSNMAYNHYASQYFIQQNSTILRGLDPDETGFVKNPISTKRNNLGFYGLGVWGTNIDQRATYLSKRVQDANAQSILKTKVTDLSVDVNNSLTINWTIGVENRTSANSSTYTLYIVSKRLGLIKSVNVTNFIKTATTTSLSGSFIYPNTATDYSDDILFAYILDENMLGDFDQVARLRYLSRNRSYGYGISINTGGLTLSTDEVIVDSVLQASPNLTITLTRKFSDYTETNYLSVLNLQDGTRNILSTVNWAKGEASKVINVKMDSAIFTNSFTAIFELLKTSTATTALTSVMLGLRVANYSNRALIKLVDQSDVVIDNLLNNSAYYLDVQYSYNIDFNRIKPVLKITKNNLTGTVILGTPQSLGNSRYLYPISFVNFVPDLGFNYVPLSIELTNELGTLTTNKISTYVNNNTVNASGAGNFTLIDTTVKDIDGGVKAIFTMIPDNLNVLPDFTTFSVVSDLGFEVIDAPVYLNNQLQFSLFIPTESAGKTMVITVKYMQPNGSYLSVAVFGYTVAETGNVLKLYGVSGKQIFNPILNEKFRIVFFGGVAKEIQDVKVSLDTTIATRSSGLVFGDDAVLNVDGSYTITQGTLTVPPTKSIQVSIPGWISVKAINPAVIDGTDFTDSGLFYLKTIVNYKDGTSEVKSIPIEVPLSYIDVNIYDMTGVLIEPTVKVGDSFVLSITSSDIDLTKVNAVNITGDLKDNLVVDHFTLDVMNNTVIVVINAISEKDLGDLDLKLTGVQTIDVLYQNQFTIKG